MIIRKFAALACFSALRSEYKHLSMVYSLFARSLPGSTGRIFDVACRYGYLQIICGITNISFQYKYALQYWVIRWSVLRYR